MNLRQLSEGHVTGAIDHARRIHAAPSPLRTQGYRNHATVGESSKILISTHPHCTFADLSSSYMAVVSRGANQEGAHDGDRQNERERSCLAGFQDGSER